jgi:hypothetical protein
MPLTRNTIGLTILVGQAAFGQITQSPTASL